MFFFLFLNTHMLWLELHVQGDYKDYIEDDEEVKTMVEDIMNVVQENAQECKVSAAKLCFVLFLSREVSYLHVWELQAWSILWFHQGVLLLDFTQWMLWHSENCFLIDLCAYSLLLLAI